MMDRETLLKRKAWADSYWSEPHAAHNFHLQFALGLPEAQWDPAVLANRHGRANQQYNIVKAMGNQVKNPILESPPEIQIYPGDGATKSAATLLNGLIRHIQTKSQAHRAYMHALDCMIFGGIGAWRITVEDESESEFAQDKEVCIEIVDDPTSIKFGPARKPDYSDARWVTHEYTIPCVEVLERWPSAKDYLGSTEEDEPVTILEHWYKEGGRVLCCYHLDTGDILETVEDYKGKRLPFVLAVAPTHVIGGKLNIFPLTYDLIAAQREVNWLKSEAVTVTAAHPKARFMAEEGSIEEGDMGDYNRSATDPVDILWYRRNHQKPEVIAPPDPPVGYMTLAQSNIQMARDITGIYPDMGQQTQRGMDQASGKALKHQRAIASVAGAHFVDALKNALQTTGEITLDLCKWYMNDDKIRISMGADGTPSLVSFGAMMVDGVANVDLEEGQYGVTVSTGANYATMREELLDRLGEITARSPQVFNLVADFLISQWPIPGTEDLAERFRMALLPPNVQKMLADKQGTDPAERAMSATLAAQVAQQENEQLKQVLQAMTEHVKKLDAALVEAQAQAKSKNEENATRRETARMNAEVSMHVADANNETKLQIERERQDAQIRQSELAHAQAMEARAIDHEIAQDSQAMEWPALEDGAI
jgi:hypothetical protein